MDAFNGADFDTVKSVKRADFELIFDMAENIESAVQSRSRIDRLSDKMLTTIFFRLVLGLG